MFSKFLVAGINTSAHGQCKKWFEHIALTPDACTT